jgi:hypothetical protein
MKTLEDMRQELAVTREILRLEAKRADEMAERLLAECRSLRESLGDGHLYDLAFSVVGKAAVAAAICAARLNQQLDLLEA